MSRDPPLVEPRSAGLIDRAESFDGSNGENVTTTDCKVSGGSIVLGTLTDTVSRPSDNNQSASATAKKGIQIEPKANIDTLTAYASSETLSVSHAYIYDSAGSLVADESFDSPTTNSGSGNWEFSNVGLQAGETYNLVVDSDGSEYYRGYIDSTSSTSGDDIDIIGGASGNSSTDSQMSNIGSVETRREPTEATATIEWPHPADIYRWDSVLFQRAEDGETVSVDVQESADGGSTWDTIATDVNRGQEITADPANEVRFKMNLSRSDTANNPTLDAAYRRYVV